MAVAGAKHEREEQERLVREKAQVRREEEETERQRQLEQKEAQAERRRVKLQREMVAKRERERFRKMQAIQDFIRVVLGADAHVQKRFLEEMIDAQVLCECRSVCACTYVGLSLYLSLCRSLCPSLSAGLCLSL